VDKKYNFFKNAIYKQSDHILLTKLSTESEFIFFLLF